MNSSESIWLYVLVGLLSFASFIGICLLFMINFNIRVRNKSYSNTKLLIYSIFGITSYTLSPFIAALYMLKANHLKNQSIGLLIQITGALCWRFGLLFVYLLFTERMKYLFNNTKYQSSSIIYNLFKVGAIIFCVIDLIKDCIVYLNIIGVTHISDNNIYNFYDIIQIFSQIIDVILSFGLYILFQKKLILLNMDVGSKTSEQKHITKVFSRITVLSMISVISSQIYMGVLLIIFIFEPKIYILLVHILWIIMSFECMISGICIYLSFDFSIQLYYAICNPLDKYCQSIWRKRNIQLNGNDLQMDLLSQHRI